MLLSGSYLLVAIAASAVSYIIAYRKGRNAPGWAWASLLLIFPVLIILFAAGRNSESKSVTNLNKSWNNLSAYDPEIRGAIERLLPLGEPVVEDFRRIYSQVQNKSAIPSIIRDIEQKWIELKKEGFEKIEEKDGVDILKNVNNVYYVAGRKTTELKTARLLASASARRARDLSDG